MRDFMAIGRSFAVAERGMAATSHPQATASRCGNAEGGGNAIDAALTAVAVQGVVEPQTTGIGGDCFALYSPKGGMPVALNGSGRTPAKLTQADMLTAAAAIFRRLRPRPSPCPVQSMHDAG